MPNAPDSLGGSTGGRASSSTRRANETTHLDGLGRHRNRPASGTSAERARCAACSVTRPAQRTIDRQLAAVRPILPTRPSAPTWPPVPTRPVGPDRTVGPTPPPVPTRPSAPTWPPAPTARPYRPTVGPDLAVGPDRPPLPGRPTAGCEKLTTAPVVRISLLEFRNTLDNGIVNVLASGNGISSPGS